MQTNSFVIQWYALVDNDACEMSRSRYNVNTILTMSRTLNISHMLLSVTGNTPPCNLYYQILGFNRRKPICIVLLSVKVITQDFATKYK